MYVPVNVSEYEDGKMMKGPTSAASCKGEVYQSSAISFVFHPIGAATTAVMSAYV